MVIPRPTNERIGSLLVDTADQELDRGLSGRRQVVTGYRIAQLKDVGLRQEAVIRSPGDCW